MVRRALSFAMARRLKSTASRLEHPDVGLLYPELEARVANTPRNGPLIVMQDWHDRSGTFKAHTEHGLRHLARRIRKYAGLPETVSFASFRKGGMTEMGEAGLTDQQIIGLERPQDAPDGQRLFEGYRTAAHWRRNATVGASPGAEDRNGQGVFVGIACRNGFAVERTRTRARFLYSQEKLAGGHARNRTGVRGFAIRCVTTPPRGPTAGACIMRRFGVAMAARCGAGAASAVGRNG